MTLPHLFLRAVKNSQTQSLSTEYKKKRKNWASVFQLTDARKIAALRAQPKKLKVHLEFFAEICLEIFVEICSENLQESV